MRSPIIIPIKGRGFINQGSGLCLEGQEDLVSRLISGITGVLYGL